MKSQSRDCLKSHPDFGIMGTSFGNVPLFLGDLTLFIIAILCLIVVTLTTSYDIVMMKALLRNVLFPRAQAEMIKSVIKFLYFTLVCEAFLLFYIVQTKI